MTTPHQGREALVAQFELLMRLADDLNVSDAAIGMRIRNLRTDFRSALTSAVREESKITGITAAELVADYLKLRCNSCDEGDAANIIHLLYENGVRFAHPENSLTPAVAPDGAGEAIPLADHDEIGRKVLDQPWEIQKAMVTITAHCTALTDEFRYGKVADLAGCISQCCLELATALAQAQEPREDK